MTEWEQAGRGAMIGARSLAAALGLPPPTAEQIEVIEAPMEPMLVVAGAGAGKTETMASRVVWLVANRHLPYEQTLGANFGSVRVAAERDGFKAIEAVKSR